MRVLNALDLITRRSKRVLAKQLLYSLLSKASRSRIDNKQERKLVISLTTFPSRLKTTTLCLESIFQQELKPDILHLWLAKEEFPDQQIPLCLQRFIKRGLMVSFMPGNLRPYHKLVHAVTAYPDHKIVTIDDDVFYPPRFLKTLWEQHLQTPEQIVCFWGHYLMPQTNGKLTPFNIMRTYLIGSNTPSLNLLPLGIGGVLYPPDSLSSEITNHEQFLALAPTADDTWFKACSLLKNTPCRRVKPQNISFDQIRNSQEVALWHTNQTENDIQLKRVFEAFGLHTKLSSIAEEDNWLKNEPDYKIPSAKSLKN